MRDRVNSFSRTKKIVLGAAATLLIVFAVDHLFPPNMTRAETLSTEIVDRHGVLLRAFLSKDGYWRLRTTPAEVNSRYLTLLKAYEDKRFASHWGVDPLAIGRAGLQLASARHVISGGSTLTMQVARLLEPRPRGIGSKLIQILRALQLEERYSKNEILSLYLTLAPFGGNVEGVRAASLTYFGREPSALTLSEAAMLVALPQSPARLRPDRHAIAAKAGRDKVLARVLGDGVITASDVSVAQHEGIESTRLALPMSAPHLSQHLADTSRGERIVTTLDSGLQSAVERLATRELAYLDPDSNLAIVIVDNRTRSVRAYEGGANYWGAAGKLDLAARPRSPGSALKPFIYGLAFDDLILHPATRMSDQATIFGDYAPRDFSGDFQGEVTAAGALRMSLNVPAVMTLERVGPLRFTQALENAGAHLAFPTRNATPSLPVALGGLGISLADITMLYAGIAEGGVAQPLHFRQDEKLGTAHRLFGPVAAYYLREILSGAMLPDGWAMGQGLEHKRRIAFKTGTSYGFRDAWSVGFSNDYTVGVWVGRPDGAPSAGRIGRETAAPILLKVFDLLPPDRRPAPLPPAGAIMAANAEQLPADLRVFTRATQKDAPVQSNVPPPAIAFPPNGATVPLPEAKAEEKFITLKAQGGHEPLTWLVNGQLLGSFDRFQPVSYAPEGEGFARVTVVDAQGRSDTSEIRFKHMR